jgi:ATP-dependent protease ClpP protease subunit
MSKDAPKLAIRTKSEALSTKYTVMFDSDIEESSEFHEQFYVMEQAGKDDLVEVCISSVGGSVATISKFQDVVKNSEAHFHAKLHGYGYSAGGALFLLCDTQEVSDLATFMAHSIQTGYGGGTQAIESHSTMSSAQNRKLCDMLYEGFLSPEEIDRICDGAEIWMEANEIRERLEKRQAIRDQATIEEMKTQYPVDVYAEQAVSDILEDCQQFGYDVRDIVNNMQGVVASLELEDEDNTTKELLEVEFDGQSVYFFRVGYDLLAATRDDLVFVAQELGIVHAWNISEEKLRQRIFDFLNEED